MEQKIAKIWQDFLTIDQISIHDDFFELGGSSLIATGLVAKLRNAFQTDISSKDLLNAPTIAELAQVMETAVSMQDVPDAPKAPALPASLVRIQRGADRKNPLFLVHPIDGQVLFYRELARGLDPDRPVYGFQAPGLEGETEPFTRIEDMAAYYIRSMRGIQPHGPYFLGGTSFGGIVAFEMSQQLHALDQRVEVLFLIDSPIPGKTLFGLEDDADILVFIAENVLKLEKDSVSAKDLRKLAPEAQADHVLEKARISRQLPAGFESSQLRQILSVFVANEKAMKTYAPGMYPGRLIFFRAQEPWEKGNSYHPEHFWTDLAGRGIEINTVPGNHITMNYQPHVRIIAERLMETSP